MPKAAPAAVPDGMSPRRFVTFRVADRLFALPAEEVAEIIPVPPAARVPQSPKALLGLANLRGTVLPLVSLRLLLGCDAGSEMRAVVLSGAAPLALAVDAVDAFISLEAADIETRQAELAAEPGERLRGAFQTRAGDGVAKILDIASLLAAIFRQSTQPKQPVRDPGRAVAARAAAAPTEDHQFLVAFEVAGQDFALALDVVQEIVPFPDSVATAPRAEAVLLGVTSYRDTLLPLLSLRGLLGFPMEASAAGKVIVTQAGGALVGLVADRMRAIIPADVKCVDPAPAMLAARTGGEARIKAIFRGEGGRRLISILAPEQLFREDVMQRLGSSSTPPASRPDAAEQSPSETRQYLVFRLAEEEFGLPISAVDEVARVPDTITRVPKTPKFLEGVMNLRGAVLPVIDQRRRFDLPKFRGEGQRLVVVHTDRHRAGLIVDSVSEVLRCPAAAIEPAPDLTEDMTRLVSGIVNLDGRLVLLLDPSELLTQAEHGLLDAFDAGQARA